MVFLVSGTYLACGRQAPLPQDQTLPLGADDQALLPVIEKPPSIPIAVQGKAMKVLVTGATGFIGRQVVQQLREAGAELRLASRYPERLGPGQDGVPCRCPVSMRRRLPSWRLPGMLRMSSIARA